MLKIWKLPFRYAQLLTNEQSCLRAVSTVQNSASSKTITSSQLIDSREVKLYKCYTPVSERQPLGPKQVSTRAAHHLVEALAVCPSQPQESRIRKHCLNQAPCSVLSALACHLPQLVLFFSFQLLAQWTAAMTGIGIAQVRPWAENLPIPPVRPTNLRILPLLLHFSSHYRPLEMLSDMSDLLIFHNSQMWWCVCLTNN